MRETVQALLCNHRWEGGLPSGHSWCPRCQRYDDHPAVVQADRLRAWWRRWAPGRFNVRGGDVVIMLGTYRWPVYFLVRLHYRWDRETELPGITVGLCIWRVRLNLGLGSGWQDEDGEDRTLGYVNLSLRTYGWRYIGCWLGHQPKTYRGTGGYTYCGRCDEQIGGDA